VKKGRKGKMKVKKGNNVRVDYHGITKDKKYTISTNEQGPVKFKVGAGSVPMGVEKGVIGMKVGEIRRITLNPEEGFGIRKDEFVTKIDRNQIPGNVAPKIGHKFQFKTSKGGLKEVYVADIQNDTITLDANHPLTGRTVELELKMLEIE
jgi:FKBP-type peptidyl-prolyl cis-trans isomerase 2